VDGLSDLEFVVAHGLLHDAGMLDRPPSRRGRKPLLLEIIDISSTESAATG